MKVNTFLVKYQLRLEISKTIKSLEGLTKLRSYTKATITRLKEKCSIPLMDSRLRYNLVINHIYKAFGEGFNILKWVRSQRLG